MELKNNNQPPIYLYQKDTKAVTYKDFVNKELYYFSNMDNERSIPSMVDGLKPGQRKVLFTCIKRNDKKEVKVKLQYLKSKLSRVTLVWGFPDELAPMFSTQYKFTRCFPVHAAYAMFQIAHLSVKFAVFCLEVLIEIMFV